MRLATENQTPTQHRTGARRLRYCHAGLRPGRSQSGMTLIELIISCAILLVLASAALPMARYRVMYHKERQLRSNLQEIRDAIDGYNQAAYDQKIKTEQSTQGYPPDLDTLVKGVPLGASSDKIIRFLRKIPIDPMTGKADWGLRAVGDDYDATTWGGKNVFDIYSSSRATATDGTRYADW
jgi:general secretion pathway protein G